MLDTIEVCATATPTASVIWMHGLGADGQDFVPVVEMLALSDVRFILPHAPYRAVTLNRGYEMRAWYDIFSLDRQAKQDEIGIRAMQSDINALITHEIARGIPAQRIVLAGFSQGGAMALFTASRYPSTLAGVLALSTYLPMATHQAAEAHTNNLNTPIWMAHGVADTVIGMEMATQSRDVLVATGASVEWHTYAMAHSVCEDEIADIRAFLLRVIPPITHA